MARAGAEEMAALPGSRRAALSYSPSRNSGSTRVYGLASSSSSASQRRPASGSKKLPEPLRRAVADSLATNATSSLYASGIHGGTSVVVSEAARILRDFIANPSTTDLAYGVLVEHALAERDRSPAVVPKCVALLKRYLLRYVPKLQTLRQIDQFCVNIIVECESVTGQRGSLFSKSLSQSSGTSSAISSALVPSSSASSFASVSLVKSLHYVRSLVGRHIPKLSFQPIGSMNSGASKQLLPSLSSLLSQSFTSQLSPKAVKARDSLDFKHDTGASSSELSRVDSSSTRETNMYISPDLLSWRCPGEGGQQTSSFLKESSPLRSLDVHNHGFLEAGAASLLAGDMVAKIKDQPWKHFITQDLPDIGLSQPSTDTMASSFASIHGHLKTITASKRMKASPQQVWDNVPISSFYPRARPLFQYRHYSEQQTLKLSFAEIQEVIAEVCSEASIPNAKQLSTTSLMAKRNAQPATDVAISVLIKLVIDMYMMDPAVAAPLTLYMLEGMLSSERSASRARAFDFLLNLGIHAQLLEPMFPEDRPGPEAAESPKETDINNDLLAGALEAASPKPSLQKKFDSPVDKFESWLLIILSEILRLLVQIEEREEIVWASALSCLFYFVCDRGQILKRRLQALDIRVVKTLLETSREYSWSEVVHRNLICMLTNMFYQSSNGDSTSVNPETPMFLTEQVDLLGGIEFICLEYSQASSREEKHNLFLVLFDYVLNQINETCLANGVDAYAHDEIEPIVSMLTIAGAPEAFYIAVKHGMEGMGELLKSFVSSALLRSPNYERLYMVLEKVTRKLDMAISSFTRLDSEFSYMLQLTKSYKSFSNIEDGSGEIEKARLSWLTLHSLLHSEKSAYRHHGYIWLIQLLVSEINGSKNGSIWLNIKRFQEQIILYGNQETSYLEVPISISMFCGLLKSKSSVIRWGFLYVLEKFLMLCKLYLHESEHKLTNHKDTSDNVVENSIGIANAIIDIMSAALSLVVLNTETDHINILKMCDILFAQLCLRFHSTNEVTTVDFRRSNALFHPKSHRHNGDIEGHLSVALEASRKNQQKDEIRNASSHGTDEPTLISSTASMAALLLRGYAIAPIQLVAHTPVSLFYWPLIQLAGAATDDIALGVAVGSKGRGNIPGGTSDIRAALLLLLIGKCTEDPEAFVEIEGKEFFRGWLEDTDSRVAYYSAAFLLKRIMTEVPETYQRMLQSLIFKAQQSNNEKLLENPYLQMRGILQLSNDLGAQL